MRALTGLIDLLSKHSNARSLKRSKLQRQKTYCEVVGTNHVSKKCIFLALVALPPTTSFTLASRWKLCASNRLVAFGMAKKFRPPCRCVWNRLSRFFLSGQYYRIWNFCITKINLIMLYYRAFVCLQWRFEEEEPAQVRLMTARGEPPRHGSHSSGCV